MDKFARVGVTWDGKRGIVMRDGKVYHITTKPMINMDFDSLYAETGNSFKFLANKKIPLSDDEVRLITKWCEKVKLTRMVFAADKDGIFLGKVAETDKRIAYIVHICPPNEEQHFYWQPGYGWKLSQGVDADGNWLSNVPVTELAYKIDMPPKQPYYKWDPNKQVWYDARSFEAKRKEKEEKIYQDCDALRPQRAGLVEEHVRAYYEALEVRKQGYTSAQGYPLLQADLDAFPELSLKDVTDEIIARAELEAMFVADIKRARRIGLAAIRAATTTEELHDAYESFLSMTQIIRRTWHIED